MNSALVTRREGAVLILSNNNPAARNALSPEYYHAVMDGLRAAGGWNHGPGGWRGHGGHWGPRR